MKLLFCASEAAPFCKTGGLADVAGALPGALAGLGLDVSVVLPLYDAVPDWARREMTFVRMLHVPLAWRNQTCGVFSLQRDGVTWYFLDNGYYFRRRDLYGHYDDGERFAFFSKAIADMIPALELEVDVIHANDWQTALIPVYLKCLYAGDPRYSGISSMKLLAQVCALLAEHGLRVGNADLTIVAQAPKLAPHIPVMRQNLAQALDLPPDRVSVKATTTERLGFEGRQEGISAQAVVLLCAKSAAV